MLMEIVLVGCSPICCMPLATFVVAPPGLESINVEPTYQLPQTLHEKR